MNEGADEAALTDFVDAWNENAESIPIGVALIHPDTFVALGGTLPPDRPKGACCIRVEDGVASWYVLEADA